MKRGKLCALISIVLMLAAGASAEFQVNTYTQHHQTHPAVAMNAAGDFAVVWRSHPVDGRGGGVYGRCFHADGTPIGAEFQVNSSVADVDNWKPAVAISGSGRVVVAWVAMQQSDRNIVGRMFNVQGSPLTDEFLVNVTAPEAAHSAPNIGMNSAGAFVIVWTRRCGAGLLERTRAYGRVYGADGSAAGEEFCIAGRAQARWPDVAVEDSGRFVVTWLRMGDTYNRPYGEYVMFRRFEPDGRPSDCTVCLTGDLCNRWYGPSVAVGETGQFAIIWAIGPFPYDICMQTFDSAGEPLTAPYVIDDCLAGNRGHPCVTTDGRGEYLAVWDSLGEDGDCYGVFGQCCTSDGELHGGTLGLNTFATGRQWYPDAAMSPDGDYVVVWISEDQDGAGYGIFGETGAR